MTRLIRVGIPARRSLPRDRPWSGLIVLVFLLFRSSAALGHDVALTRVDAVLSAEGAYRIDFYHDVDAALADARPGHLTPSDHARIEALSPAERAARLDDIKSMILRRVRIRFDEQPSTPGIEFISSPSSFGATSAAAPGDAHESKPRTIVRLRGEIPAGASAFDFRASRSFGAIALQVTDTAGRHARELVERGARSRAIPVRGPGDSDPTAASTVFQYMYLGFEHIIPKGTDHILFILGLYLLSPRLKPLLWQVTAFTLAHTASLGLSACGLVALSPAIVEPLIALSIAFVAIENMLTEKLSPWRPFVVFSFGLLHGLGFAGVLGEIGLPQGNFVSALLGFNVGVEVGQLGVIVLALMAVGAFRKTEWYRPRVVRPASAAIAVIGLYWAVERMMG